MEAMSVENQAKKLGRRCANSRALKALLPWLGFMVIMYVILRSFGSGGSRVGSDTDLLDVALSGGSQSASSVVDAFVYISMGTMAKEQLTEYSIASLRKVGGWKGPVYVLTDRPSCFATAVSSFDIKTAVVPTEISKDIMKIKNLKATLFEYLPPGVDSVVYLDVDIMLQRPVSHFLMDIGSSLARMTDGFDIGAFPDAQGHYLGFCSGCEKWHTGVILAKRDHGDKCMAQWSNNITGGKFDSDQESLDEAENAGMCEHTLTMPPSYLLFAKDYIGMALTSGHTFLHVTAAGRPDSQGYFYKFLVMPSLRGKTADELKNLEKSPLCMMP